MSSTNTSKTKAKTNGKKSKHLPMEIRYDKRAPVRAQEFVLNSFTDQLLLDCASGVARAADGSKSIMPVHTRIAMTWKTAQRLSRVLNKAIQEHDQKIADRSATS